MKKTETGVTQLQAKECLGLPGANRCWKKQGDSSPRTFRGSVALLHHYISLLASSTVKEYISVDLSYQI